LSARAALLLALLTAAHASSCLAFTPPGLWEIGEIGPMFPAVTRDNARNTAHDGRFLYFISNAGGGFAVVDDADPTRPAVVGTLSLSGIHLEVLEPGRYVLASTPSGLAVVGVSDPRAPRIAAELRLGCWVHGFFLKGGIAYCAMHIAGRLAIANVTDPLRPSRLSEIPIGAAHDVWVEGSIAYVTSYTGAGGLYVVDVSDPKVPRIAAFIREGRMYSYARAHGGLLFVGTHRPSAGLDVFNISDPLRPEFVRTIEPRRESLGYWMDVHGGRLFAADPHGGEIAVIDAGALTVEEWHYVGYPYLSHLLVRGDRLYASTHREIEGRYYCLIKVYAIGAPAEPPEPRPPEPPSPRGRGNPSWCGQ